MNEIIEKAIADTSIKNAIVYKEKATLEAKEIMNSSSLVMNNFLDKIAVFSGGILSVSLTVFLALYQQINLNNVLLILFWLFFLLSMIAAIFSRYFDSRYLAKEAGKAHGLGEVNYRETVLNKDYKFVITPEPTDERYDTNKKNLGIFKKDLQKLDKHIKRYSNLRQISDIISFSSFIIGIIFMGIILLGIANGVSTKEDNRNSVNIKSNIILRTGIVEIDKN